jgi:histidyl-tRNA synthetase
MSQEKKIKPSLPSGTRDFLPGEVAKRNYIFDVIKKVFLIVKKHLKKQLKIFHILNMINLLV